MLASIHMVRPRWHDALIVPALVVILLVGIRVLWWDDVRSALGWGTSAGSAEPDHPPPVTPGKV
jgi:hypothetical protein